MYVAHTNHWRKTGVKTLERELFPTASPPETNSVIFPGIKLATIQYPVNYYPIKFGKVVSGTSL